MGRWKSATFKEYIREQLHCFSDGMSSQMKQKFNFVNIEEGACFDITSTVITQPYHAPTLITPDDHTHD
jgi:hypothetical protein